VDEQARMPSRRPVICAAPDCSMNLINARGAAGAGTIFRSNGEPVSAKPISGSFPAFARRFVPNGRFPTIGSTAQQVLKRHEILPYSVYAVPQNCASVKITISTGLLRKNHVLSGISDRDTVVYSKDKCQIRPDRLNGRARPYIPARDPRYSKTGKTGPLVEPGVDTKSMWKNVATVWTRQLHAPKPH